MEAGILVPLGLFFSVAAAVIVSVITRARTRRLLIERGMLNEQYSVVLAAEARLRALAALRWGLVAAGLALGLLVAGGLGFRFDGAPTPAGVGLVVLGTAVGSLAYYFVTRERPVPAGHAAVRSSPPAASAVAGPAG